jgi:hypothetical protein
MRPCPRGAIGEAAPTPNVSTTMSVAIFTDSTYRAEFLDDLTDEMRASFEERAGYLRLRERVQ